MPLINIAEAKKGSTEEIIDSLKKLSDIITERELNNPNTDLDTVMEHVLGKDDIWDNPMNMNDIIVAGESIIAVPSIPPMWNNNNEMMDGKSVASVIQLPGGAPYYSYEDGTETFIDSRSTTLRGRRSVALHKAVPGMIVSFHHYTNHKGIRDKLRIDVKRVSYDNHGYLMSEPLSEKYALFEMPKRGENKTTKNSIINL